MKLIRTSAFTYFMNCKLINNKHKKLLYLLRSRCFDAKYNFKKLFKNNLKCRFGCLVTEDQNHIFKNCQILNSLCKQKNNIEYEGIFGDITVQTRTIRLFGAIERGRLHLKDHLLPGGKCSQDPCKSNSLLLDFAADIIIS